MNLITFAVGKPCPIQIPEGCVIAFTPSGLIVYVNITSPTVKERKLFHGNITKIGLVKHQRMGLLLVDFGEGFNFGATFDAGIEPPANLPDYDEFQSPMRVAISFVGVDATNNTVFGLRSLTPSALVSGLLVKTIQSQSASSISFDQHNALVSSSNMAFPSFNSMKRAALAFDKVG